MSDLRARPLDVCMQESRPHSQGWICKTTWPLADVLNDQYFLNMRQSLGAGHTIRISRFDRNDANDAAAVCLETCEVIVQSAGPSALAVPIALISPVVLLGDGTPKGAYEVRRGQAGKFKLMDGENVVAEYGSKLEAEAALNKKLAA